MPVQRIARHIERDVIRQFDGQVLLLFRNNAAVIAMDNRNRASPVPLPRQTPVPQTVLGYTLSNAVALTEGNGRIDCLLTGLMGLARKPTDVEHLFGLRWYIGFLQMIGMTFIRQEDGRDRQIVFAGEIEIPLVMCGTAENRPGAVVHKDEVRDVDGQFLRRVEGMPHADAGVAAQLLRGFDRFFGSTPLTAFGDEGCNLGVLSFQRTGERVVG